MCKFIPAPWHLLFSWACCTTSQNDATQTQVYRSSLDNDGRDRSFHLAQQTLYGTEVF